MDKDYSKLLVYKQCESNRICSNAILCTHDGRYNIDESSPSKHGVEDAGYEILFKDVQHDEKLDD